MPYRRVLTIQDISCVGQCSLTVALPILSACGLETVILPSAVLSTHTAGFSGFTVRDLTDDMPAIKAHWQKENIRFDAFYTGYLGSTKQIDYVSDIMKTLGNSGAPKIVDPAMADFGKLYPAFDMPYVAKMSELCAQADIILPNITEACFLTGMDYREEYDQAYIEELIAKLTQLGTRTVVLTGVSYHPDKLGVLVSESGKMTYYEHKRIPKSCHGTGDVYASVCVGAMLKGRSVVEAARLAADFTVRCIENTIGDANHWYGVKFEPLLAELGRELAD
ncbi:MAG: pyridoxamine kinase [bacterium]|nr:pyridoxamine kinase [bacterium]